MHLHGSLGREAATGRGTVFAIREMLKATHAGKIQDHTFVIQVGLNKDYIVQDGLCRCFCLDFVICTQLWHRVCHQGDAEGHTCWQDPAPHVCDPGGLLRAAMADDGFGC